MTDIEGPLAVPDRIRAASQSPTDPRDVYLVRECLQELEERRAKQYAHIEHPTSAPRQQRLGNRNVAARCILCWESFIERE